MIAFEAILLGEVVLCEKIGFELIKDISKEINDHRGTPKGGIKLDVRSTFHDTSVPVRCSAGHQSCSTRIPNNP